MKINKTFNKHFIKSCILLFLIINFIQTFELRASAVLSFYNSNVKLNGPASNNFKGNVGLDDQERGIVITAGDGAHDESLLRLVSEKLDSDSFLIDYRLFRTCEVTASFTNDKKKLILNFSPYSLENRKKNDNFDVHVEISNYEKFIDKTKYTTEYAVQDFLRTQCNNRKNKILSYKNEFTLAVENYRKKSKELESLNVQIRNHAKDLEGLKSSISETESQLKDIEYLKDSYQMQLKSISSLTNGASKLISNETKKKEELQKKQKELEDQIVQSQNDARKEEEFSNKLKERYSKNMESTKDVENEIITTQKNLSDVDNSLSNVRSEQLRVNYDLKHIESLRTSLEKNLADIAEQMDSLMKKNEEHQNSIKKMIRDRENFNKAIIEEKEEIQKMESEINELIKKKSKKEESLKSKFDEMKNIENNLTNRKIETEQISCQVKSLTEKKERLEGSEKMELTNKLESLRIKAKSYEERESSFLKDKKRLSDQLNDINNQKELLNKKITENKNDIERETNELIEKNRKTNTLEKNKNDLFNELRKKEFKIKNLRMESQNYSSEIENVNKSVNSTEENMRTFQDILNDLIVKKAPTEQLYNTLVEDKNKKENIIKLENQKIKEQGEKLKKEVPSATIMIDLAQDEAYNNLNENFSEEAERNKPKWRTLIEKIIS